MINKFNFNLVKTILFTGFALIAFAANSVLCRLALGMKLIDASSFTIVRLLSGAVVLFLIVLSSNRNKTPVPATGSWSASLMLFIYASTFSFAYTLLNTGTGALILFAVVQITMILWSVVSGNRLHSIEWLGLFVAFSGFIYLILPDVITPSSGGFLLMTVAGIAWGIYTLNGRNSKNPVLDTAYNFFRTIPLVLILLFFTLSNASYTLMGILLAVISGGIASGIGYAAWYIALTGLSVTQAAVFQLSVPIFAALGGIVFVSESITLRLMVSTTLILGGILMVVLAQYYSVRSQMDVND
ncbi:MAG: DMT family transporter [Methylococcales bacterium]|nr:DMT family transporter [Methylococcales bacterium]